MNEPNQNQDTPRQRSYRWPWFVLAAIVLGIALAVIWMTVEVRRQQHYRELNTQQFPQGNTVGSTNPTR